MNQPWIYMCSPSWTPLPPPSPSHPSGSSQCTSPEHLSHASNLGWWSAETVLFHIAFYFMKVETWACILDPPLSVLTSCLTSPHHKLPHFRAFMRTAGTSICKDPTCCMIFIIYLTNIGQVLTMGRYSAFLVKKTGSIKDCGNTVTEILVSVPLGCL